MREQHERHTDILDTAAQTAQALLDDAIAHARRQQARMPPPDGHCMYCQAEIEDFGIARFCDSECAAGWEHEQEVKRKQGLLS